MKHLIERLESMTESKLPSIESLLQRLSDDPARYYEITPGVLRKHVDRDRKDEKKRKSNRSGRSESDWVLAGRPGTAGWYVRSNFKHYGPFGSEDEATALGQFMTGSDYVTRQDGTEASWRLGENQLTMDAIGARSWAETKARHPIDGSFAKSAKMYQKAVKSLKAVRDGKPYDEYHVGKPISLRIRR